MKKISIVLIFILASFLAFSDQQGKKVARVKVAKGSAMMILPDGSQAAVKRGDWIPEGAIIKTQPKSFVRLSFIDKSSMNIGPKSELKIEKFSKKEAGVINVLSGKIRSQVSKDYLQMEKGKSKLFVKSKNAVMGIRGTDFLFSTNPKSGATTAVLFEGSVVFSKLNKKNRGQNLEKIVNQGRSIKPGQFSVASRSFKKATVPSKMSNRQIKSLESNVEFRVVDKKKMKKMQKKMKSIAPPGLSGEVVMSDSSAKQMNGVIASNNIAPKLDKTQMDNSKGYRSGDDIKPADGTMVDVDTGMMIPIGKDASFDKNNNEWVSSSAGTVDNKTGEYIPPAGMGKTDEGMLVKIDAGTGKAVAEINPNVVAGLPPEKVSSMDNMQMNEIKSQETNRLPASDEQANEKQDTQVNNNVEKEDVIIGAQEAMLQPPTTCGTSCQGTGGGVPSTFSNGAPTSTAPVPVRRPSTKVNITIKKSSGSAGTN